MCHGSLYDRFQKMILAKLKRDFLLCDDGIGTEVKSVYLSYTGLSLADRCPIGQQVSV